MRTTLDISDAVLKELRQRSSTSGRAFRQIVEETLQIGLASKPPARKPVKLKTYPAGIKPAYRGVSMNQLYDRLEAEPPLKVAKS